VVYAFHAFFLTMGKFFSGCRTFRTNTEQEKDSRGQPTSREGAEWFMVSGVRTRISNLIHHCTQMTPSTKQSLRCLVLVGGRSLRKKDLGDPATLLPFRTDDPPGWVRTQRDIYGPRAGRSVGARTSINSCEKYRWFDSVSHVIDESWAIRISGGPCNRVPRFSKIFPTMVLPGN